MYTTLKSNCFGCIKLFALQSTFEFEMTDLLRSASKNILNLLVLHLSTHRERMLSGVQMLAEIEPGTKTNSVSMFVSVY